MRKGKSKIAVLIAGLVAAVTLAPVIEAAPATAATAVPFTTTRALAVDPGTGRVFVAGDDAVAVLAPDGSLIKTIPGIYGAWGIDATQGAIWVNESTAGAIAKIDPVSMTLTATYTVGAPVSSELTIVGTTAWIGGREQHSGIGRFDLTTSTYTTVGTFYAPAARRLGSSTSEVLIYSRGISNGPFWRIDVAPPHTVRVQGEADTSLSSLAVDPTGTRFVATSGSPAGYQEFDAATLKPTGTQYRSQYWPRAVIWVGAHGGTIAGINGGSESALTIHTAGAAAPVADISAPVRNAPRGLALSPDGSRAYLIPDDASSVQVVDVRPTATAISRSSAVRGTPTSITVTGQALGGTTSVSVGGASVEPDATTPASVRFTLPAGAPVGVQPVVLHGATGDATTSITITASTGAVLQGTVLAGDAPVPGAGLTLSGGGLASPVMATATSTGAYAFGAQAAGSTYSLTVHDPTDQAPDQVIRGIVLTPNDPTTVDVDLARPSARHAEVARSKLSADGARDLVVDPGTGRTAISNGDEVAVLDTDGLLVGRFRGLFGAAGLTMLGSKLYVAAPDAGRIVRIDLATLTVTGSWATGAPGVRSIAAAGGKVWFSTGAQQHRNLASLDPATGTVVPTSVHFYDPELHSIQGAPDRFSVTEGLSSVETKIMDGSTTTPTPITSIDTFRADWVPYGRYTAVASTNRLYGIDGREFSLTDLRVTGVRYPGSGPTAFSPGRGGIVATGLTVARVGTPSATHTFAGTADVTGLDAGGDHLIAVQGGEAVVRDLRPIVTGSSPAQLRASTTVTVNGTGLGALSAVTIDGTPVPFHDVTAQSVQLDLPNLAGGIHRLVLTTPWGSTPATPLAIVPPGPPDAPPSVVTSGAVGGVRIQWAAPGYDGGFPVTGYTATATPGGQSCTTTTELTCTITGLTPGATVIVKVRATNEKGAGPSSEPVTATVPTLPSAPPGLLASPGARSAVATWGYPANGGMSVTGFRVCAVPATDSFPATTTCPTASASSFRRTISSLSPGTTYKVAVAATTAVGTGPLSAPVEVTPFDLPSAPRSLAATPGVRSALVSWQAPLSDGGRPIGAYRACAYEMAGAEVVGARCTDVGAVTSMTFTGLEGARTYRFDVLAMNEGGKGPAAAWTSPLVIPASAPGEPAQVSATAAKQAVRVGWTAPKLTGGVPVSGYEVCVGTDPALTPTTASCTTVDADARTATIGGRAATITQYAAVAAINPLGTGPRTFAGSPVVPFTLPGAPLQVQAIVGDRSATVSWVGPLTDGGSEVGSWIITPHIGAEAQTPIPVSGYFPTERTVPGLVNGTTYTFTVQAVNAGGPGVASAPSQPITPVGPPDPFASWDAFAARQLADFTGSSGSKASRAATVAKLTNGQLAPADFTAGLLAHPWQGPVVAPTARLYWAYFGRIPDHGGLEYWSAKRRTGATLIRISASFAGSSEFKRTYGSLSNAKFVDLVYRNVLGRPGDAGGRAYWIGKLDRGTSRGQMMISFSESGEYVRTQAGRVAVVQVYGAMLDRSPTTAELAEWKDRPVRNLIESIRSSETYADHVG